MENLSYEMLVQAYRAALQLNVDEDFIKLLKNELRRREEKGGKTSPSFPSTR
ncbi:hypothetical protein GCM10007216_29540 [Thalassobacillus devorans]|uniref:Sporulation inhibitor A n=1 Tax=Thalassobacillus devorans TaxID=279813 RepID=A0ABQ1PGQ1_9BACI|nr:sporulation histidine kinase inhibitor Sda [Thalassobacillus devorans]NIK29458.1 hypothetical protein [Thalassobacillus devorans]GGC96851.1 hypothetical protein GCM10007216_29540 [Thalassobacillus devorans]